MARLRVPRAAATEIDAVALLEGEVVHDTTNDNLRLGDGSTLGGKRLVDAASDVTISAAMAAVVQSATLADGRTAFGLGSIATQNAGSVAITGGTITGITDLDVAGTNIAFNTKSGYMEIVRDTSPLNYTGTRASLVLQHRDAASGAASELIPGAVFQFTSSGSGTVNSGAETSSTIWHGLFSSHTKTGDGSAHCFTGTGQLSTVGAGGYNELALITGELTNIGSALGTIAGVEVLLKDSPDSGASSYSTKLHGYVSRLAKYNATSRKSVHFLASAEGTQAPDAIMGVNTGGLAQWQRALDFQGATFASGQWGLAPNNTSLAWLTSGAVAKPILSLNSSNVVCLFGASTTGVFNFFNSDLEEQFRVTGVDNPTGYINIAGSAGADPDIAAAGSATNVTIKITPKGTGVVLIDKTEPGFDLLADTAQRWRSAISESNSKFYLYDVTNTKFPFLVNPNSTSVLEIGASAIDVTGLLQVDSFRIDQTPTAVSAGGPVAIGSASTIGHRVSINMNGTTYWVPASTSAF